VEEGERGEGIAKTGKQKRVRHKNRTLLIHFVLIIDVTHRPKGLGESKPELQEPSGCSVQGNLLT
jgi:hypothetical protein